MVYGLWQSAGGLAAQDYRQTILANNLANVDTPGFKLDRVAFIERLNAARTKGQSATRIPSLDRMTGGVFETPTHIDFMQGPLVPSASRFDVAIAGDGFLRVRTKDGIRVTRDGRLQPDVSGTLRHLASGGAVLDGQGKPIVVDPGVTAAIKIDSAGRILQGDDGVGQIGLVDFVDRQQLRKEGENLLSADGARQKQAAGEFRQFFHEGSNVEPVTVLVDMIAASRAYQLNASMLSLQDESLGRTVNDLGRIA